MKIVTEVKVVKEVKIVNEVIACDVSPVAMFILLDTFLPFLTMENYRT